MVITVAGKLWKPLEARALLISSKEVFSGRIISHLHKLKRHQINQYGTHRTARCTCLIWLCIVAGYDLNCSTRVLLAGRLQRPFCLYEPTNWVIKSLLKSEVLCSLYLDLQQNREFKDVNHYSKIVVQVCWSKKIFYDILRQLFVTGAICRYRQSFFHPNWTVLLFYHASNSQPLSHITSGLRPF